MKKALFCALFLLGLTGCVTLEKIPDPPAIPSKGGLLIDTELLQDCQEDAVLAGGQEVDVVNWGIEMKIRLRECAKRHKALVNTIQSVK